MRKRKARKPAKDRPEKPYRDFPLSPHASGAWQKKILGKVHYFGRWGKIVKGKMERLPGDGWKEALDLYKAQADDLHAGRTPRVRKMGEGLTLVVLCDAFFVAKKRKLKTGEITALTLAGHKQVTDLLIAQFGRDRLVDDIAADDFAALREVMAERWGLVRLCNQIQAVKSVFKFGYGSGLIVAPVRYGDEFVKPSAAVLRKNRAKNGEKMIKEVELRRILDALTGKEVETGQTDEKTGKPVKITLASNPNLRAMVLLGVNCGFNNKDCADLPLKALDLDGGWVNFPRPKTGIPRRCPLWPDTVTALREAIAGRPIPRQGEAAGLVFLTSRGRAWIVRGQANPVSVAARAAMKAVGIHHDRIGFATLRHVFRTVADGCRNQVAVNQIVGHADGSMASVYRERIDDSRLRAVADHVRAWLWPNNSGEQTRVK